MIKKERPKSAVLERMGSSAAFARQLFAVASGNFRNIKASSSPSSLGGEKGKGEGGKGLNLLAFSLSPFPSPHLAFLGWQTTRARVSPIERVLSKEFQGENR